MTKQVTVVITPRDRYSKLEACVADLYALTDESLFDLVILDLGYPREDLDAGLKQLEGKTNYQIIDYGRVIPMEAMRKVSAEIDTAYVVFMDNDARVQEGWLPPLIETAEATSAAVISPVILEASGVDEGAETRTHFFTTELRVLDVEEKPYLVEYKSYRRSDPSELPTDPTDTEAFELHCVMFKTASLKELELPTMTIREHLDIGMQLRIRGERLVVEPRSKVLFDNLGSRAKLSDLRYFNLRWNGTITEKSSRLFEKRWGYRFYSEEAIYLWAIRRRIFLLLRWLHIPVSLANKVDRVFGAIRRRVAPVWDPVPNAEARAESLYQTLPEATPKQLDHAIV
ncbi:MAG: glycosyltransferase [Pseudomonadota bacterium]